MATVTVQQEYSPRLMHFIQKLEETDSLFHDVTEKRAEAINNLYHYGVTESKELGHNEAINLIRKTVGCSRASIYRYLPESVKRKYLHKESLNVRQLKEQVQYDKIELICTSENKETGEPYETKFLFENVVIENEKGRLKIFYREKDIHLKAK